MPKNLRLTPLNRKKLSSISSEDRNARDHAVVIDENSYWTGKVWSRILKNGSGFTRWYRIVVTKLHAEDEYLVYAQDGAIEPNSLIEVAPGATCQCAIVLGGDAEQEPEAPKDFEVYVEEHATTENLGNHELVLNETLKWIPLPTEKSIYIEPDVEEVNLRPWQRKAHFGVSLVNRSYLPISAEVRATPGDCSKDAGIVGTEEPLREPIPPQTEQPVGCAITLNHRLTEPCTINVDATCHIPDLDYEQATMAKAVQLIPVPLLKIWYDWVVVGVVAFLLFWALFGMPPIVHCYTRVIIDNPPPGVRADELTVILTPERSGSGDPLVIEKKDKIGTTPGEFNYDFDWRYVWKGFRWGWTKNKLEIKIVPKNPVGAYVGYDWDAPQTDEPVHVTSADGVSSAVIHVKVSKKGEGLVITPVLDTVNAPADGAIIMLSGTFHGATGDKPISQVQYARGQSIHVACSDADLPASLDINASVDKNPVGAGKIDNITLKDGVLSCAIKFAKQSFPAAVLNIPASDPPSPYTFTITVPGQPPIRLGSAGPPTPVTIPMAAAGSTAQVVILSNGVAVQQKSVDLTAGKSADAPPWKPTIGVSPPITILPPITGGGGGGDSDHKLPAIDPNIKEACDRIQHPELVLALTKELRRPGHLELNFQAILAKDGSVQLSSTPNADCVLQVYEVYANGATNAVLTKSLSDTKKPVLLRKDAPPWSYPITPGSNAVGYVAIGWISTIYSSADMIDLLTSNGAQGLTGWAISTQDIKK